MDQELKNKLKEINDDQTLSNIEKNKRKQEIIKRFYDKKNKSIKIQKIECSHYPNKKCSDFYFNCCEKFYECVRCHNENENHPFQLKNIKCIECSCFQDIGTHCNHCNIQFSKSFCKLCGLFSDQEHLYHCNDCGICRVGKKEELIHCKNCNICGFKDNHECFLLGKINDDYQCSFCHENLYTSMIPLQKLNCSHFAHTDCVQKSIQNNSIKCGLCRKTFLNDEQAKNMWSMIDLEKAHTYMPLFLKIGEIYKSKYGLFVLEDKKDIQEEYIIQTSESQYIVKGSLYEWKINNKVYINTNDLLLTRKSHCNDCLKTNFNLFHVVGIKCKSCGSYNVS